MLQYSQPGPSARSYCASLAFARSPVLLSPDVSWLPDPVANAPTDWTTITLADSDAHDESTSCDTIFTTRYCSKAITIVNASDDGAATEPSIAAATHDATANYNLATHVSWAARDATGIDLYSCFNQSTLDSVAYRAFA